MCNVENNSDINIADKIAVTTAELQVILSCGKVTAIRVGTEAGARMQFGRRVLWNIEKIRAYLNSVSE